METELWEECTRYIKAVTCESVRRDEIVWCFMFDLFALNAARPEGMKTDNQRYTGYIAGGYTEEEDAVFYDSGDESGGGQSWTLVTMVERQTYVKLSEEKLIPKSHILSLLRTYNCYHEGKNFQLRTREDIRYCKMGETHGRAGTSLTSTLIFRQIMRTNNLRPYKLPIWQQFSSQTFIPGSFPT
ncbi:Ras association domain containing protein 4 [Dissostichus eleginoides]|uniref:Ras association domain containing protein 4 n=1 Tax=Dissostichus eleginoides TaxID=100907 RepID=A0AAD9FNG3_DISEL|nr:Ras association domain containing protein 4 [Dissostichus eleginoides]